MLNIVPSNFITVKKFPVQTIGIYNFFKRLNMS